MRRQQAVRESRDVACIIFVVLLPVAGFGIVGVLQSVDVAGTPFTAGGVVSALVGLAAAWVAVHVFREILRLNRLLANPKLIMGLGKDLDEVTGLQWSGLLPFSGRRF